MKTASHSRAPVALRISLLAACSLAPQFLQAHNLQICEQSDPVHTVSGSVTFRVFHVETNSFVANPVTFRVGLCSQVFPDVGFGSFIIYQTLGPDVEVTSVTAANYGVGGAQSPAVLHTNLKAARATVEISTDVTAFVTFTNASIPQNYNFMTLNVPGLTDTVATDINSHGDITGYGTAAGGQQTGFLYRSGHFTTIFVPGSAGTTANGLNDSDHVVGTYTNITGSHGFEYILGNYTPIDAPPPALPNTTTLVGINNSGQIAGDAIVPTVIDPHASDGFVDTAGSFVLAPAPSPGSRFQLNGINNAGHLIWNFQGLEIPDSVAYGTVNSITLLVGTFGSFNAINDSDHIAITSGGLSYIIASPTDFTLGSPLIYPGSTRTTVLGLNNSLHIVGSYTDSTNHTHAFAGSPLENH